MGGIECNPVCAEITYGPERLCLMLDAKNSFWTDLEWNDIVSYKDCEFQLEMQNNIYNFRGRFDRDAVPAVRDVRSRIEAGH